MESVAFTIPGLPVQWARAGGKGPIRFTPGKQRNYGGMIRDAAKAAMNGREAFDEPVEMTVHAVYPWPTSLSLKKRGKKWARWKGTRPDADNLGKIVADNMNGIVFKDDARVALLTISKNYGEHAEIRVAVRPLTDVVP